MRRFEDFARRMIETTLAHVLGERLSPSVMLDALLRAIEDAQHVGAALPNAFHIALNPADYQALLAQQPRLAEVLAESARLAMLHLNFVLETPPRVWLHADASLPPYAVRVQARHIAPIAPPPDTRTQPSQTPLPRRPFLITPDGRQIALVNKRVRIGRAHDNDVILDDRRVSRHHLELRWQDELKRFLAVDLGSAGGTRLNGEPIQQCTLEAGDVISLAGVELIYGEAETPAATRTLRQ
ncbi:MAG: FHA domain-containing protein [Thermoflexales bacterium]|nr:FHA domain-containing protein [Thermoflexales bacterium]MCS7324251.1 FHA domain-containing protein [Thermoflexales bacterium]MCX7939218.1 FHA domain-containing protein [Thermoflexales bacterium]MDW8054476.1 DUF3662 domain-containing protein [Anaerolineae bacterium]MDW8292734.1 DUF3662 domain-containing protein [Anaerolineae bacterium]